MSKFVHFKSDAFSLVEVTIALALASFGLVILVGLIPTGLQQVKEGSAESVAVNILSEMVSDIRNSQTSGGNSTIPIQTGGTGKAYFDESGRFLGANTIPPEAIYAVSWQIRKTNAATGMPANAHLIVCWPATVANPTALAEAIVPLGYEPGATP